MSVPPKTSACKNNHKKGEKKYSRESLSSQLVSQMRLIDNTVVSQH